MRLAGAGRRRASIRPPRSSCCCRTSTPTTACRSSPRSSRRSTISRWRMLLARAMSSPGHATNRLAQVLDTLAPDDAAQAARADARQDADQRARLRQQAADRRHPQVARRAAAASTTSRTYVSTDYRESMDTGRRRAPPTSPRAACRRRWTSGSRRSAHDSVRRLSGQLLIDLLRNETVAEPHGRDGARHGRVRRGAAARRRVCRMRCR